MKHHIIYISLLILLALSLPGYYFDSESRNFIFILGFVAVWRYSWAIVHFTRAMIYLHIVFPGKRARANELTAEEDPEHAFFLITSFRISSETSIPVYRSVVKEAIACGVPSTIIASVVEMSEERIAKQTFYAQNPPEHVKLKLVRIPGTGKRDALATGFRAISNSQVDLFRSVASVIDGDTILTPGCTRKCFQLFELNPKLGALTTDEECTLEGEMKSIEIYRRWYNLRFAQRNIYMSSQALSNKVLTLTGRMSMFRASIIGDSKFIDMVEFDHINHWRLGTFRFLTGDDKSSWYHVLKDGWEMTYVPDAVVETVESPPHSDFFIGANTLMRRWFGNVLRTNARARDVPIKVTGIFTWWTLVDQRIGMWTSLFGLCTASLGSIIAGPGLLMAYAFWVMFTRYIMSWSLFISHKKFSISWPILVYFNQIYGSLVKIYVLSHLNKQKWTRQKTTLKNIKSRNQEWLSELGSNISWLTSMAIFVVGIGFLVGVFQLQDIFKFGAFLFHSA